MLQVVTGGVVRGSARKVNGETRMTAPLTSIPPRWFWVVVVALVVAGLVAPLGRRNDWVGWGAMGIVGLVAVGLWGGLAYGIGGAVLRWWRGE